MKTNLQIGLFKGICIALISICLLTIGFKLAVTSTISFGADFSIYWQAGKALFLRGVSPYDSATTDLIQKGIYGRLAKPNEDQVRFAYPPFSLLAVLPAVRMSYPWAQAYWMAFNLVLVFAAVWKVCKKPSLWILLGLIFFYPVSRGIILGQFALLIGSGLLFSYGLLHEINPTSHSKQWVAGILLALCAMKPHLTGLIILFFILDSLQKHEWRVLAGLAAGIGIFAGISWVMVPTWVSDWIRLIFAYIGYVPIQPILQTWLTAFGLNGSSIWLKTGLILLAFLMSFFILTAWWKKQLPDYIALGWLVLISQLVNPNPNSVLSDQVVFLLPLLIWLNNQTVKRWLKAVVWGAFVLIPWVLFGVFFHGKEPYEVASGLALIFTIWFTGGLLTLYVKQSSTLHSSRYNSIDK